MGQERCGALIRGARRLHATSWTVNCFWRLQRARRDALIWVKVGGNRVDGCRVAEQWRACGVCFWLYHRNQRHRTRSLPPLRETHAAKVFLYVGVVTHQDQTGSCITAISSENRIYNLCSVMLSLISAQKTLYAEQWWRCLIYNSPKISVGSGPR